MLRGLKVILQEHKSLLQDLKIQMALEKINLEKFQAEKDASAKSKLNTDICAIRGQIKTD